MRTVEEIKAEFNYATSQEKLDKLWLEYFRTNLKGIPSDKFEQICKAERENRLVVLPCKVGDVVFTIINRKIESMTVVKIDSDIQMVYFKINNICYKDFISYSASFEEFNKTVFLTKAEAEKALLKEGEADA